MSTFFRTQMTGRRGNPLVLRKILPNPDLVIASTGADIGFYIVSLVGQVIVKLKIIFPYFFEAICCLSDFRHMDITASTHVREAWKQLYSRFKGMIYHSVA